MITLLIKTRNSIALMSAVIVLLLLATACGGQAQSITAVTPVPLESLEVAAVGELGDEAESLVTVTAATTDETAADIAPIATPTPLSINLPNDEVLRMMMAQDEMLKLEPREGYVEIEEEVPLLYFWELFDGYDPETGLILSDKAISLDGRQVTMQGFMAPPLQLDLTWFQLTLAPVGACPFCTSAQTVVPDMITVYPTQDPILYSWEPVRVTGQFEVGAASDPETGMFSLARIYADEVEIGVSLE